MSLNKYFDNIYALYINGSEYIKIKKKLEDLGITAEYFKGVIGKDRPEYKDFIEKQVRKRLVNQSNNNQNKNNQTKNTKKIINNRNNILMLTQGQYGHTLSFINILKDAIKKKYKKILILEADIYFCKDFNEQLNKYDKLLENFKLFYFGCSQLYFYKELTWDEIDIDVAKNLGYYQSYHTLGTFALGLDQSVFREYLKILEKMETASDIALLNIQDAYPNESYVCYPNIICCNIVRSGTAGIRKNKIIQVDRLNDYHWLCDYNFNDRIYINLLSHIKNTTFGPKTIKKRTIREKNNKIQNKNNKKYKLTLNINSYIGEINEVNDKINDLINIYDIMNKKVDITVKNINNSNKIEILFDLDKAAKYIFLDIENIFVDDYNVILL